MAFNLMDMLTEQMTPDNIRSVASFLGEDSGLVTKAISAAAPLLLSSIIDSSSKPGGREQFNNAIDQADSGLLGNLAGALSGGSNNSSLATTGLSMLGSLVGGNKLDLLNKAISGFSGLSSGSSKSLLGVAAPLIMGMLSKKKQDDGLDNNGLLGMLGGQKDNILKAISPDMSKAFSGLGILDGLMGKAGDGVKDAAQAASHTAQQVAGEGGSLLKKLIPLIAMVLLGLLAYYYITKPSVVQEPAYTQPAAVTPKYVAPTKIAQPLNQPLTLGNVNLEKNLTDIFDNTKQILSGVTDAGTAGIALSSLSGVNQSLDSLINLAGQLPPEGKQMLASLTNRLSSGLDSTIDQVYKVPGAGNVLGESINTLRQKLSILSNI
ncbi:MAG: DUF937 domain-containing protein [Methyloprofundus sp.]|nr:DUF937 domain-containing protein [Methyloprofundus sp.]